MQVAKNAALKMQKHKEATRELPCACMPELSRLLFFYY
jgi:hypothetical protein